MKLIAASPELDPIGTKVYSIGKKGRDGLIRKGYEIAEDYSEIINEPLYQDAADLTQELLSEFGSGELSGLHFF